MNDITVYLVATRDPDNSDDLFSDFEVFRTREASLTHAKQEQDRTGEPGTDVIEYVLRADGSKTKTYIKDHEQPAIVKAGDQMVIVEWRSGETKEKGYWCSPMSLTSLRMLNHEPGLVIGSKWSTAQYDFEVLPYNISK